MNFKGKLEQLIPYFKQNPDNLQLFYTDGKLTSTGAKSLSYECAYTLEMIVTDYKGSPDILFLAIQDFIRTEQSDLIYNPDKQNDITFEIEPLNNETYDIAIRIPLTERVIVKNNDKTLEVYHAPEPQIPDPLLELSLDLIHVKGTTEEKVDELRNTKVKQNK